MNKIYEIFEYFGMEFVFKNYFGMSTSIPRIHQNIYENR